MKATRREPQDIDYVIIRFPMTIHGPNGDVQGKKGDYLITEGDRQYFMRPDEFTAAFTPKVDPPNAPPTYVPYPMPYPVYPQPYQPTWQPYRFHTVSSPNITIGGGQTTLLQSQTNDLTSALHPTISGSIVGSTLTCKGLDASGMVGG